MVAWNKVTTNLWHEIKREQFDIVIASRFLKESQIEDFQLMRLNFSKIGNLLSRLTLKRNILLNWLYEWLLYIKEKSCQKYIKEMEPDGFKFV